MQHPLASFTHCPRCGADHFQAHDERSKHCENCGFTYYHNASASTVAVILNANHELLVGRRAFPPAADTLDLPGGFVNPGETIEAGLLREIKEETGCDAEIVRYLFSYPNTYSFSDFNVHTADSFFLCRLKKNAHLQAADDASDLMWMSFDELHPEDFGLASIRKGVERILEEGL